MNLLPQTRHAIINKLWHNYRHSTPEVNRIVELLHQQQDNIVLDHLALIDLPSPQSSRDHLIQIFSAMGFQTRGSGYLADKQNDFSWLAEDDAVGKNAQKVLPQIVVADFRLHELSPSISTLIEKYTQQMSPCPLTEIQSLCNRTYHGDTVAQEKLIALVLNYCSGRNWPSPTIADYKKVREENELLAWVLVFGRQPNHFGIAVHHLASFSNLETFNAVIKSTLHLSLNGRDGEIKGNEQVGIVQSSTADNLIDIPLADGTIKIPSPFIEFVWRYSNVTTQTATAWEDFFTGFNAPNANRVIESVYT